MEQFVYVIMWSLNTNVALTPNDNRLQFAEIIQHVK